MTDAIAALEYEIYEKTRQLAALKQAAEPVAVPNYQFATVDGETSLLDLFGTRDRLLVIHNMGQACRYCTLWADGFNGLLAHLEAAMAVVLVSKDDPDTQRRFAQSRGWRFRLASHGGGEYISEQTVMAEQGNMPGAVAYERRGEEIFRRGSGVFGPGDLYCPQWPLLAMAGISEEDWTPQFSYWQRPEKLDDGGANLPD